MMCKSHAIIVVQYKHYLRGIALDNFTFSKVFDKKCTGCSLFLTRFYCDPVCLFDTNSEVFTEVSTCFKLIKSKPMSCCLELKKIDKVEFFRLANLHASVFCCCCVDMSGYIFLELHIRLFLCFKRNRVSWTSGRQTVYVCSECLVHVFLYFPFVF